MSNSRIIIADPHGCYKTLMALVAKLPEGVPITFAGDLIDRGKDSRKVIEFVKNGGHDCVRGNHEQMMIDEIEFKILKSGEEIATADFMSGIWLMNGGESTLDSYALGECKKAEVGPYKYKEQDVEAVKEHVAWFKTLPYYIEYPELVDDKGQYLLVSHTTPARVWDQRNSNSSEFKDHLLWERDPFPPKIEGVYSVYGHTPQRDGATVKEYFACIDCGCYYKRNGFGRLVAFQFPDMIVYEQENIE